MQLIVLGMHRSGTSSITRLLNLAGAYFGPEGIATDANDENPKGFWERRDVRDVCDGLLHATGHDWWRVSDLDLAAIPGEERDGLLTAMRRIILELDAHRPWVVKEPRLCVLAPLVRPLLEVPVFVHVVREPLEIARSLEARNGFPQPVGIALWEAYTTRAFDASADDPRVLVSYGELMQDPHATIDRLIGQLEELGVQGLRRPTEREVSAFVTDGLHRHHDEATARRGQLNSVQQALAKTLDEGRMPRRTKGALSVGALLTLRAFEASQDAEEERVEALQRLDEAISSAATERDRLEDEHARELDEAAREHEAVVRDHEAQVSELRRALADRATAARDAASHLAEAERRIRTVQRSRMVRLSARLARLRGTAGLDTAVRRARKEVDLASSALGMEDATDLLPAGDVPDDPPPPIDVLKEGRRRARDAGERPKVAVLAWDVGHNPFGRAHLLAELLQGSFDVEIWGSQFERYGSTLWAPLRHTSIPVHRIRGSELPGYFDSLDDAARRIDADALVVSKPRLPSFALGVRAAEVWPRPLVLDVDDHEPAFFDESSPLDLEELYEHRDDPDLKLPFGRLWTRASDGVVSAVEALTVSNVELQERYGGIVVPHARDEVLFDPHRYDRDEARRRLRLHEGERLVLFGGTPRAHKGIIELLTAVDRLADPGVRVGVFETRELEELRKEIGDLDRWILPLAVHEMSELPRLLAAADLSCALQDPAHPVSRYQMPAKVTDAMAMGVPCLVTDVPPLRPLIDKDLVTVLEPGAPLHDALRDALHDGEAARDRAERARDEFLESFSFSAVRPVLGGMLTELLDAPSAAPRRALTDLTSTARSILRPGAIAPRRRRQIEPGAELDLVMFWKQNDTGLYGRRQDMFLRYLERSGRFRSIVHFDHPISAEALARVARRSIGSDDQNRLVLAQTLKRIAHRSDQAAMLQRTFVYSGGRRSKLLRLPARDEFPDHVRQVLADAGLGRRPVVFWVYPTHALFPAVADLLRPDLVVADVVDDNRTWYEPGSPKEEELGRNYAEVLGRSDIVLANCQQVADAMRAFADDVHVLPNACELPDGRPLGARPPALTSLRGPIVGYAGNLSDRIDVPLLRDLARARPDWNLVLLGSTHLDRSALALDAEPNVHFLGVQPYEKAKDLIRHFDVGLIPHVDNTMTRSMNPLKAYVYASLGVPIVATPVANLDEMQAFIRVAEGTDGFVRAIEDALAAGPGASPGADALRPHSWESRVEDVLDLIDAEIARRAVETLVR